MKQTTSRWAILAAAAFTAALPLAAAGAATQSTSEQVLVEQVRSALLKLPYYGVFDHLTFQVTGGEVTLSGDVTRPWLKTQAEQAVRSIKGIDGVTSTINVLPLSPYDDRLRLALLRTVYGQNALTKYNHINPPIRIIVANGQVRLEGVVLNDGDRNIAFITANGVPGVFHVENKLRLERDVI
jgi:hyperosmotically inducible periplasmic protein